jgi:hypothetical protein
MASRRRSEPGAYAESGKLQDITTALASGAFRAHVVTLDRLHLFFIDVFYVRT